MGNIKTLVLAVALISALLSFSFLILTFMQPSGVPEKGPVFRIENDAVKEDLIKRGLIEKYPNGTRVIHLKGVEELIKKGVYRINPDGVLEMNIPPGSYEELEGNIKLSISERFTEEKDGAHIFLNLATERIYGCCDHQLNSDVKIQGNTIIVEVKNVLKCGHAEGEGPATFSKDLDRIEGDYQLILKHKTKEDKYNLKITKDKIEINPIISTFTVFNQSNILFRVTENVIWIDCGHYDRVGCEENQEHIKICDQFFKEPLISNLQPFEPEEGEYAVKWFNKGHKHFKFFGNISDLRELVESYAIYTSRDTKDKERCLLLSIRTWRGDFFYTWDYTWERKNAPPRENRQPTVEKIAVWQNGEEKIIDPESSEYNEIGNILIQTLHKLDLQAVCAFTEERIHQEIKRNDKVVEITFKQANDFPIRQWIEPEGRYNVLKNVKSAIFILEDTQGEGLGGHILVGSERKDRDERCSWKITQEDMEKLGPCEGIVGYVFSEDHGCIAVSGCKYRHIEDIVPFNSKEECELACGRMVWSCWGIKKKESNELDKTWVAEINSIIQRPKPIISVNSTVFEGERWMSILGDGKVTCYSDHYYPSHKEIVIKEGHISREEIDALLELFSNLSKYSDYTVNASEQLISDHMDCVFDPVGGGTKISCIPLNKTLRLSVKPPSFPEPETATITAKEIMERIDKIYREAEVSEKRKEINPYLISLHFEPFAPSYQPNQMITFNASLRLVPELKRILYEWDFGDGSKKGYGKIVRYSYSSPGNYTIRLKITSEDVVGIKDETVAIRSTPAPVIWIEKKVNPEIEHGAATTGGKVAVTIKVENRRDEEIFDVDVKDEFPEGKFKLVSGDTSMDLTSLKPGESKILKYELRALEAGYSVLKPATITYKDESGVQYSNKSNTAEVMVRVPPMGPPIPEFVALFVIVGLLAVAVVAAYLVLRRLK